MKNHNHLYPFLLLATLLQLLCPAVVSALPARNTLIQSTRAANYHVAVCDQNSKTVRVFPRDSDTWNSDAIFWSFTADTSSWKFWDNSWNSLSDVTIRNTGAHGWIALVTASGGKVGIINITKEKRETSLDDLMWHATPGGNPHSIERIPRNGAIIVASSHAHGLTMYVPSDADDINNYDKLEKSNFSYDLEGAHGVLWDPNGGDSPGEGFLWALGDKYLVKYAVKGKGKDTRLVPVGDPFALPRKGLGHDLQPDFTDPNVLLVTDTYGAYTFNTKTNKWKTLKEKRKLKSLVRHPSGEYMWITGSKDEMGQYVEFGDKVGSAKDKKGWDDARFYKARIYSTAFE